MKLVIISGKDVDVVIDNKDGAAGLINAVATAFKDYSTGRVKMPQRTVIYLDNDWWGVMPCGSRNIGFSVKVVNVIEGNKARELPTTQGIVILMDDITGVPLAVINGTAMTAWRTAAATAVSIRYMARRADNVAIIGAGLQAKYHVLLLTRVFPIRKLIIYSRTRTKAIELMKVAQGRGVDAMVADTGHDAVKHADVVITATTSREPVLLGSWLHDGIHIASIGAPEINSRELDDEVIRRASVIAVDSRVAVTNETGDVIIPIRNGLITENNLIEIGEIISGLRRGRSGDNDITLFKSVGIAVEDLAAASYIYKNAESRGIGNAVEL
ncbi:ornithine cyclodeaminase family protein [Vulcanisaeta souniana]|uniref:Ornithine cyclodeaminase n=1 Tax=Vulcanisaeta souniana JCM 11219 TaxID=1293586 RepID=A0A830E5J6_9CREN|nr:ornithine cyclodeaminase family protein [Vulcanisaeta souniana]BDR91340.1 ornithine cyclodeaminase [Vulcanisaeta souniana JCM 11219]GGI72462.1 ornithine cyclodeaminase [Vulcanisaeta souniana JCM 11219]